MIVMMKTKTMIWTLGFLLALMIQSAVLAERLTGRNNQPTERLWRQLPPAPAIATTHGPEETAQRVRGAMFGSGSPSQLRALILDH
jgi:hypothetical protein